MARATVAALALLLLAVGSGRAQPPAPMGASFLVLEQATVLQSPSPTRPTRIPTRTQRPTNTRFPSRTPTFTPTPTVTMTPTRVYRMTCPGDSNWDGKVTVAEAVAAIGSASTGCPTLCPGDCDENGTVDQCEVDLIVNKLYLKPEELWRCPAADVDKDGYVGHRDLPAIYSAQADRCP